MSTLSTLTLLPLSVSVSVVTDSLVSNERKTKMELNEMTTLIRTVWSDSMSDNGAIWAKSNATLKQARIDYPELYVEAIEWLYSNKVGI